jgi:hypothetical protein
MTTTTIRLGLIGTRHIRDFYFRSCREKHRFSSEETIKRVAEEEGIRYYSCEYCGGFHLTHRKKLRKH